MAIDNSDLIKRSQAAETARANVQESWEAIERFVTPYRGKMFKDVSMEESVEWDKRYLYDSTAVFAHQVLSSTLHGAVTSPSVRWFQMRFREEALNKDKASRIWLEEAQESIYYELQDSNFNLEINEAYQDICGFGTTFLDLEENDGDNAAWNGLFFKSIPLKEGFFELNSETGLVLRWYRKLKWTPQQILSKFGSKVPQVVVDMDAHGNTSKLDVLFAVVPTNNKITPLGDRVRNDRRPFEGRYILVNGAETLGKPIGYYEMPVFAGRYLKTSESMWGHGPAHIAMGDILTLNQARKQQLIAAEKIIDPTLFAEERALIGDLDLSSAAVNVVRDKDGIIPFITGANIPVSDMMIQQLQQAVRDYFHTDQLQMPAPQAQPMTATEVQIRYEQLQRLMAPTLSRLRNDLLDPIISRAFRMMSRKGVIPQPPELVIETDPSFDIQYMGSLARTEKLDEMASVERWAMFGAQLAEVLPGVLDIPDPHEIMRGAGKSLNIPPQMMFDETEVKKKEQAKAEQQAQAEQAQEAMMAGQAAEQMGKGAQALGEAQAMDMDLEEQMNAGPQ